MTFNDHCLSECVMAYMYTVQEKCRLNSEIEDVKRRLVHAEKEVLSAKDECIQLHEANQALHKEVSVAYLLTYFTELLKLCVNNHIEIIETDNISEWC